MYRPTKLRLLNLERRDVPAQFGIPWSNHQISLSFVPDGTNIHGSASNLTSYFDTSGIGAETAQVEILRAVQEWAASANLTIGVVDDNGSALGVAGQTQHDLRFGDIRISGRPMSSTVVAISVPPGPAAGTLAGDIIINTSQSINIGGGIGKFDLYSCMLQEVGHALGVGNSKNSESPMFESYGGVRAGLIEDDVNAAIALYGERINDGFDVVTDNGNVYTATKLAAPLDITTNAESIVQVVADISGTTDRDYYYFTVPVHSANEIAVRLQTNGLSLLMGHLTIMSAGLSVVADAELQDLGDGALVEMISGVEAGQTYYIRVERAANAEEFGVGQYRLQVDFSPSGTVATSGGSTPSWVYNDNNDDETVASAKILADNVNRPGEFGITARFGASTDVDTYMISVPSGSGSTRLLTVSINAVETGMLPMLKLLDASSNPIPYQVIRSAGGQLSLQANVTGGQNVYLVGGADSNGSTLVGDYRLDASLNVNATPFRNFFNGTVSQANPAWKKTVTINRGLVLHLALMMESGASNKNDIGALVVLNNSAGNTVLEFGAPASRSASAAVYLAPGTYQLSVGGKVRTAGSMLPEMTISLKGFSLSDPIDPLPSNPDIDDDIGESEESLPDFDWDIFWWWWW